MQSRAHVAGLLLLSSLLLLLFSSLTKSASPLQALSRACTPSANLHKQPTLNVFVTDLPPELNYGLLHEYWDFQRSSDTEKSSTDTGRSSSISRVKISTGEFLTKSVHIPLYPDDPLIKQYSAEYWLLGDLITPANERSNSVARRVWNSSLADVIFVPFFATLSAELQLHQAKGKFRHKKENADYDRQVRVLELVKNSPEWKRSQGRDHVFVLTDPVAMWHVRSEIAPAVLLTVDFGGWYMEDAKEVENQEGPLDVISHRQVSLLKDVIVPYTHLLPPLHPADDKQRGTLLYFKGARHRHRTGLVRDKLWALLKDEPGVVFEEGFPNKTGREQALKGMRSADFCLHPAEFSLFVAVHNALQPKFLVNYLKGISAQRKRSMRTRLANAQQFFEYDNGYPGGIGPVKGAVNAIWNKVSDKVPAIKEAVARERRKPLDVSVPARCQCL
ncbi:hypothetical protein GOP47_0018022 [Adiantum capillus-veneris]|uniref:Exostosin GT47 domain-containing protein n=1 Tax=Adiantum capillus-veneris TaxID=13818 RepID=A0A9D4ZA91_ADICA|nr:hypothetical protein GOP47_0018022 [Adiantum capillus-veneris]